MGGRPFFSSVLAILCGIAGMVGLVYFASNGEWPYVLACLGALATCVGLWKQWRWAWWVGFALASGWMYWNYEHRDTISMDLWFGAGVMWVYFLLVFREFN